MKAFIVDRYGKASGRLGQVPEPELRPDDVLVEVHAAGAGSGGVGTIAIQLAKHLAVACAASQSSAYGV